MLGAFMIFMIVAMFFYSLTSAINILSFIFIAVIVASYMVPLVMHRSTLRPIDFMKGVVYTLLLTPTFINIIVMYAICNIHDVSWGSRPSGAQATKASEREAKMEASYKNYRSWFLLIWLIANASCGYSVLFISRRGLDFYLLIISGILVVVVLAKILFSLLHI